MEEESGAEKPFEPTPRKLEEARKRGEAPVSQDLVTFGVYSGILLVGFTMADWSANEIGLALVPFLQNPDGLADSVFQISSRFAYGAYIWGAVLAITVWLFIPYIFALLSASLQGVFVFAPQKIKPKLSRISPISNAKQKFGADGIFNFVKSSAKLGIYSFVLYLVFVFKMNEILSLPSFPVSKIIIFTAETCFLYLGTAALVIGMISTLDYFWQRAQFLRKQRMTLKEIRDETKETEGDPLTKQQRRQRAYDIATNQMLADVPQGDVVIVNPEHYAVALQWDRTVGSAPVCIAKGVDEIAARIREVAAEHAIPIYSDPPTARALFATTDIGEEIPTDLYRAIAAAIRFADAMRKKASEAI